VSPVAVGVLLDRGVSVAAIALGLCAYIAAGTVLAVIALRLPAPPPATASEEGG
jgi:hypothetical protein